MRAWVAVGGAGLLLALACRTNPQELRARSLTPAPLAPTAAAPVTRRLTARVWADEAHRRMVLGWQVRFHRTVTGANPVLAAGLGVEIEIVSMQAWPHEGGRGSRLDDDVRALEAHDPGEGVDLVIGLLPSLGAFSADLHDLGKARVLGKHLVLRAMDDLAERDALTRQLDDLSPARRDEVYQARVAHRARTLVLHEVGHCLGALHVLRNDRLMSPTWSPSMRAFSPPNLQVMGLVLEGRGRGAEAEAESFARLLAFLRSETRAGWMPMEREGMVGLLTAPASARGFASDAPRAQRIAEEGRAAPETPKADTLSTDLAGEGRAALQEILRLNAEGDIDTAWQLLLPMLDAQGRDPGVAMLACEVAYRREAKAAVERCRVAVEVTKTDPAAPALLVGALAAAGEVEAGLAAADEAARRLRAGGVPEDRGSRLWTFLGQTLLSMGAMSRAVEAASEGDPEAAGRVAAQARELRAAVFLSAAKAEVPAKDEPRYVALAKPLNAALRAKDDGAIRRAYAALRKAGFSKVAGPAVAVCGHFAQVQRWPDAYRSCRAAVRLAPDQVEPRLGLAFAAFGSRRPAKAVRALEGAVRLAPERKDVWRLLSAAYEAAGQRAKQAKLRKRYRQRFDEGLR